MCVIGSVLPWRAGVTRRSNWRRLFHTGCWPAQLALWLGLVAACFAMPNSVYSGYSQFAKVAAGAFLVLVIILFVIWCGLCASCFSPFRGKLVWQGKR